MYSLRHSRQVLSGILLILLVSAAAVQATVHTVEIQGVAFVPDDITIIVGDTVEWVNMSSFAHTATSGTGPGDPESGDLFDAPFSGLGDTFSYTFTQAGDVPYYCIPHFAVGMTGIVRVLGTVSSAYTCVPDSGTLPFASAMAASLINNYTEQPRQIAARIDVMLASGGVVGSWKTGTVVVSAGSSITTSWNQPIPGMAVLLGTNEFQLQVEDVTPAPFNQPPFLPSGDADTSICVIVGN